MSLKETNYDEHFFVIKIFLLFFHLIYKLIKITFQQIGIDKICATKLAFYRRKKKKKTFNLILRGDKDVKFSHLGDFIL